MIFIVSIITRVQNKSKRLVNLIKIRNYEIDSQIKNS